jgi:hypothetical protein
MPLMIAAGTATGQVTVWEFILADIGTDSTVVHQQYHKQVVHQFSVLSMLADLGAYRGSSSQGCEIFGMCLDREASNLALACYSRLLVIDLHTHTVIASLGIDMYEVYHSCFNRRGDALAVSNGRLLYVVDLTIGRVVHQFSTVYFINRVLFGNTHGCSSDDAEDAIIAVDIAGDVYSWSLESGQGVVLPWLPGNADIFLQTSDDGTRIMTSTPVRSPPADPEIPEYGGVQAEADISLWDGQTGNLLACNRISRGNNIFLLDSVTALWFNYIELRLLDCESGLLTKYPLQLNDEYPCRIVNGGMKFLLWNDDDGTVRLVDGEQQSNGAGGVVAIQRLESGEKICCVCGTVSSGVVLM